MTTRALTKAVAVLGMGVAWLAALGLAATVCAEAYLQWRPSRERARSRAAAPIRARLEEGCREAGTSHVHPHYLFFLPLSPVERTAISTDICGITPEGFRKPGLEQRGTRQLAFLIGGSVAFSDMASSDAATITSDLNRLQDTFFFVTAGVPGWNSSQELSRVAFQLLDYRPALIVTLDGANDAGLTQRFAHRGGDWVGAPANFDVLQELTARHTPLQALAGLRDALLPSLAVRRHMQGEAAERARRGPLAPGDAEQGARRYVTNLTRMRDLTQASGGRFVAVFQPMAQLHRRLDVPIRDLESLESFHDATVRHVPAGLEFHDFSALFDRLLPVVHVNEGELTPDTIFVDDVHLHDRGNALLAQALWEALAGGRAAKPVPPARGHAVTWRGQRREQPRRPSPSP